jgi:hypothetical protein
MFIETLSIFPIESQIVFVVVINNIDSNIVFATLRHISKFSLLLSLTTWFTILLLQRETQTDVWVQQTNRNRTVCFDHKFVVRF